MKYYISYSILYLLLHTHIMHKVWPYSHAGYQIYICIERIICIHLSCLFLHYMFFYCFLHLHILDRFICLTCRALPDATAGYNGKRKDTARCHFAPTFTWHRMAWHHTILEMPGVQCDNVWYVWMYMGLVSLTVLLYVLHWISFNHI